MEPLTNRAILPLIALHMYCNRFPPLGSFVLLCAHTQVVGESGSGRQPQVPAQLLRPAPRGRVQGA